MEDNEISLFNACTDLVSLKKSEAFLRDLLGKRPGEWVRVRECCLQLSVVSSDVTAELFATWLPDPLGHDGYVVVMFYDDESKWSMAAHYNRGRLLGAASTNQEFQPVAAAVSTPSCSTSQQAAH